MVALWGQPHSVMGRREKPNLALVPQDEDEEDTRVSMTRICEPYSEDRAVTLRRMALSDLLELAANRLEDISFEEVIDDETLVQELRERSRTLQSEDT